MIHSSPSTFIFDNWQLWHVYAQNVFRFHLPPSIFTSATITQEANVTCLGCYNSIIPNLLPFFFPPLPPLYFSHNRIICKYKYKSCPFFLNISVSVTCLHEVMGLPCGWAVGLIIKARYAMGRIMLRKVQVSPRWKDFHFISLKKKKTKKNQGKDLEKNRT